MREYTKESTVVPLGSHPETKVIRLHLRAHPMLQGISDSDLSELAREFQIVDGAKGESLLDQGVREMEQYFVLDGILKRVVSNAEGKEMILRFAAPGDMETSYAAWRLRTPTPYSIVCVTRARVAKVPMPFWVDFIERRPAFKESFQFEVMQLMSEVMAHTITLHLLDAPGRVHRFERKHAELVDNIPQKQLAAYLNLSAETLSRLRKSGKI